MVRRSFVQRAAFIVVLSLLVACGKKDTAPATAEAATLPADVAKVAGVTSAAPVATATQTAETTMQAVNVVDGSVVATGEFISPTRSELAAKVPGRVARIYVDEGSRVSRGQALLELETDYARLNLQRAQAELARARAAENEAKRDLARKQELIAKQSIPQALFDRSQATHEQAGAARAAAEAQVALLRQQVADSTLRSPIDGVIAEKRTDVGQRLGDNTVALVVVQTSPLKLRFRVPERYLSSVRKGQAVKATVDPYPGQAFEGKVTVIGGVIDPATRSLSVETEFANRDGKLRPGLFARVELKL